MRRWTVVCEPRGDNPGKPDECQDDVDMEQGVNKGGIVICITNGAITQEVSRVGWVRRNAKRPKDSLRVAYNREKSRAEKVCEILNEHFENSGELQ